MITDEEYAHIKVTSFTKETHAELLVAIQEMESEGAKGIVVDLRENPGGLLMSVVDIISEFIPKNELIFMNLMEMDIEKIGFQKTLEIIKKSQW